MAQGGSPNREVEGTIEFDNNGDPGGIELYLDPTPFLNEGYLSYSESFQDLGGGNISVARLFTDPIGDAAGRDDLLSIALHEIGHSLGDSLANTSWIAESADGDIDVTAPRPFAGTTIPLAYNYYGVNTNFDGSVLAYGTLMVGVNGDERRIPSALDILAMAQLSQFEQVNLNPPVPEPSTLALLGIGILGLIGYGWGRIK